MLKIIKADTEQGRAVGVPFFESYLNHESEATDTFLDALPKQCLQASNWVVLKDIPEVSFTIAYNTNSLFIKYYVFETDFKADYLNTHDPVSEDSCVELFIGFDNDENYYNLEFNTLGTCLAAYGAGRIGRRRLPVDLVKNIKHLFKWETYLPDQNKYQWTLTLDIPLSMFCFSDLIGLDGRSARANVYKCGEKLMEPHYLMWNDINTDHPDYHQPDFFRKIFFERSIM